MGNLFQIINFWFSLDKAKNVDLGETYLNRNSGIEFALAIANVFLEDLKKSFYEAKFSNRRI